MEITELYPGLAFISGATIRVEDNAILLINETFTFNDCIFEMGANASIETVPSVQLGFIGCVISSCSLERWNHILIAEEAGLGFSNSRAMRGTIAIECNDCSLVNVNENSVLSDFFVGISGTEAESIIVQGNSVISDCEEQGITIGRRSVLEINDSDIQNCQIGVEATNAVSVTIHNESNIQNCPTGVTANATSIIEIIESTISNDIIGTMGISLQNCLVSQIGSNTNDDNEGNVFTNLEIGILETGTSIGSAIGDNTFNSITHFGIIQTGVLGFSIFGNTLIMSGNGIIPLQNQTGS